LKLKIRLLLARAFVAHAVSFAAFALFRCHDYLRPDDRPALRFPRAITEFAPRIARESLPVRLRIELATSLHCRFSLSLDALCVFFGASSGPQGILFTQTKSRLQESLPRAGLEVVSACAENPIVGLAI
jgi:hypothetical protein